MIDLEFLESLIRAIDESTIDSVEIERGGTRIRVSKTPPSPSGGAAVYAGGPPAGPGYPPPQGGNSGGAPAGGAVSAESAAAAAEAAAREGLVEVTSPMVGTFYQAPSPDAPAYVKPGDRVSPGDVLCIIEAMKLMNELECEVSGTIVEVGVDNAEPVEYGQVLFRIEPT